MDTGWRATDASIHKENNAAWRVAKQVRREWLATFFAGWRKRKTATLPARVDQWLALAPVLAADYLSDAAPVHRYATDLLGLKQAGGYQRRQPDRRAGARSHRGRRSGLRRHSHRGQRGGRLRPSVREPHR